LRQRTSESRGQWIDELFWNQWKRGGRGRTRTCDLLRV